MRLILLIFSFLVLIISCSKNSESNKVCFTRTSTDLNIQNNTGKTIYFIAFGQKVSPLVDWIPTCSNNNVPPKSSVSKKLSTIYSYSDEDGLVVFWWECIASKAGELHSIVLNKNEKICR